MYPLSTLYKHHSTFNLLFCGMACNGICCGARSIKLLCFVVTIIQVQHTNTCVFEYIWDFHSFFLSLSLLLWYNLECARRIIYSSFITRLPFSPHHFYLFSACFVFYLQFKEITYGLQRTNASTLLRSCLEYVMNYCHRFMPGEGGYLLDLLQNVSYFQLSCIIIIIFIIRK